MVTMPQPRLQPEGPVAKHAAPHDDTQHSYSMGTSSRGLRRGLRSPTTPGGAMANVRLWSMLALAGAQSCISAPILPVYDASHPDANPGPRGNSQWDQGKRGADTQLGITALDEKNSGYSNVANAILYRQETQSIREWPKLALESAVDLDLLQRRGEITQILRDLKVKGDKDDTTLTIQKAIARTIPTGFVPVYMTVNSMFMASETHATRYSIDDVVVWLCHLDWEGYHGQPARFAQTKDFVRHSCACPDSIANNSTIKERMNCFPQTYSPDRTHLPRHRMITRHWWEVEQHVLRQAKSGATLKPKLNGMIFHETRVGSTLVMNMLATDRANIVYSENNAAAFFAVACNFVGCDAHREEWLKIMITALQLTGKPYHERVFLKMQNLKVQRAAFPIFLRLFPRTPWVFMFRQPVQVLQSYFRDQFGGGSKCAEGQDLLAKRALRQLSRLETGNAPAVSLPVPSVHSKVAQCAANLFSICMFALMAMTRSKQGRFLNYASVRSGVFVDDIAPAHLYGLKPRSPNGGFGATWERTRTKMQKQTKYYSKRRSKWAYLLGPGYNDPVEWKDDSKSKAKEATEEVRSAAAWILDDVYIALSAAANQTTTRVPPNYVGTLIEAVRLDTGPQYMQYPSFTSLSNLSASNILDIPDRNPALQRLDFTKVSHLARALNMRRNAVPFVAHKFENVPPPSSAGNLANEELFIHHANLLKIEYTGTAGGAYADACKLAKMGSVRGIMHHNMDMYIVVLKGLLRFLLFPPSELPLLHASLIDEDLNNGVHIAAVLDRSSWLRKAVAVEVLLREGDILYLPNRWSWYSEATTLSIQCSVVCGVEGAGVVPRGREGRSDLAYFDYIHQEKLHSVQREDL